MYRLNSLVSLTVSLGGYSQMSQTLRPNIVCFGRTVQHKKLYCLCPKHFRDKTIAIAKQNIKYIKLVICKDRSHTQTTSSWCFKYLRNMEVKPLSSKKPLPLWHGSFRFGPFIYFRFIQIKKSKPRNWLLLARNNWSSRLLEKLKIHCNKLAQIDFYS